MGVVPSFNLWSLTICFTGLPHKEGTNPPVRKLIIGVPEYLGAEVEVEFDMPDPNEVAETCAVLWHKK